MRQFRHRLPYKAPQGPGLETKPAVEITPAAPPVTGSVKCCDLARASLECAKMPDRTDAQARYTVAGKRLIPGLLTLIGSTKAPFRQKFFGFVRQPDREKSDSKATL
jgi:hypothetical protein